MITPNDSWYLAEYMLATTTFLITHLLTYLINGKRTQILNVKKDHKTKRKSYTCVGRNNKYITKLFKNPNLKISFTTDGTLYKTLHYKSGITTKRSTSVISII